MPREPQAGKVACEAGMGLIPVLNFVWVWSMGHCVVVCQNQLIPAPEILLLNFQETYKMGDAPVANSTI